MRRRVSIYFIKNRKLNSEIFSCLRFVSSFLEIYNKFKNDLIANKCGYAIKEINKLNEQECWR